MPRLTAATPKYRHHKASGQAVVTIASKDHYLGPWKFQGEQDRVRPTHWRMARRRPTVLAESGATSSHCDRDHLGVLAVRQAVLSQERQAHRHGRQLQAGLIAAQEPLRPHAGDGVRATRNQGAEADMVLDGHSRRYTNENVDRIRRVFRWAASEQMIPPSVSAALATVESLRQGHMAAREGTPVMPVDDAIVEATLPHLPKIVADTVRLQRLTGARPGEICTMRPADVDRTNEAWAYVPSQHKTEHHGKRRTIFNGPKAQSILLPYLLRDTQGFCFVPADSENARIRQRHEQRITPLSCGNRPGKRRRRRNRAPGNHYTNASYRYPRQLAGTGRPRSQHNANMRLLTRQYRHSRIFTKLKSRFSWCAAIASRCRTSSSLHLKPGVLMQCLRCLALYCIEQFDFLSCHLSFVTVLSQTNLR
jgi:integrase